MPSGNRTVGRLLDVEGNVARDVATALGQPYGTIFQTDAARALKGPPEDWEAYACTLAYYLYRTSVDQPTHRAVKRCLERAVARFPGYAAAWAFLSLTHFDELRFHYRGDLTAPPTSLDAAVESAQRAAALDPTNVWALQAQMLSLFFKNDVDAALRVGERAVALNPNDTELVGDIAAILDMIALAWKGGAKWKAPEVKRHRDKLRAAYYAGRVKGKLNPTDVIDAVRAALPKNAIATSDVGSHKLLVGQGWTAYEPRSVLMSNGLSSMGYSLPAAIVTPAASKRAGFSGAMSQCIRSASEASSASSTVATLGGCGKLTGKMTDRPVATTSLSRRYSRPEPWMIAFRPNSRAYRSARRKNCSLAASMIAG